MTFSEVPIGAKFRVAFADETKELRRRLATEFALELPSPSQPCTVFVKDGDVGSTLQHNAHIDGVEGNDSLCQFYSGASVTLVP